MNNQKESMDLKINQSILLESSSSDLATHENILKEYYARYLRKVRGLSESSVKHYFDALNNISRRLKNANLIQDNIYEICDIEELKSLKDILYADNDFIQQDQKGRRMYSAGLNNYVRFAEGDGFAEVKDKISVMDVPIEAGVAIDTDKKLWKRSDIIKNQAIEYAGYACEIDNRHSTFIAEKSKKPYMEGHHAIPMKRQGMFRNSLDVYANIICMCPICHRRIHYGIKEDRLQLLNQIYESRADRLNHCGIRLSKNEFSEMAL